ncbi:MAG: toprim domain-containing protein [Marinilabiliaceae bacterium]|nr:toprim domain-containing protein [Marinilabiliaceae bacterium]
MNYSEAKNIDIVNFLSEKGIQPVKANGYQYFFLSPLRSESLPSFSVNINKNLWYDFGIGEGGDIIELVRKMFNVDFLEALQILSGNQFATFQQKPVSPKKNINNFRINKTYDEIKSYYLISYLHVRCIDYQLVKHCNHLYEVEYKAQSGKLISALGFKNDKGGYEMRNKFTKLSTSPKAISTIPGDGDVLNVFEGFMDYLSALTYYQTPKLRGTSIILNGVGQKRSLFQRLSNFKEIKLFLDNDAAGMKLNDEIREKYSTVTNVAAAKYPKFKDFNEFLMSISE